MTEPLEGDATDELVLTGSGRPMTASLTLGGLQLGFEQLRLIFGDRWKLWTDTFGWVDLAPDVADKLRAGVRPGPLNRVTHWTQTIGKRGGR